MICSLILGALIGWIASKLMGSRGGLIRNLILGVVGSAVGNWLAGRHRLCGSHPHRRGRGLRGDPGGPLAVPLRRENP